jgi:hypothetical protein
MQQKRNLIPYTSKLGCAEGWKIERLTAAGRLAFADGFARARATQTQISVRFAFPHKPSNTCKRWRSAARWALDNTQRHHCGTVRATSLKSRRALEQHAHRHCAPACAPSCRHPPHQEIFFSAKNASEGEMLRWDLLSNVKAHVFQFSISENFLIVMGKQIFTCKL